MDLSALDTALPPLLPSTFSRLPSTNKRNPGLSTQEEVESEPGSPGLPAGETSLNQNLTPDLGEDTSPGTRTDPFLAASTRLPLEILERIITYTFLRRTPTTPYSDPFPLNNTSHLLLISHSFSSLALPIFYRSVTISRPSHYQTFFNPQTGLFVFGEEGRNRWSWVREICILSSIFPPLVPSRPPQVDDETSWVVPLVFPKSERKLELACIMDRVRFLEEEPSLQLDVRRLVEEAQANPSMRSKSSALLREEFVEDTEILEQEIIEEELEAWSVMMYDASLEERIDELVQTNTELWIEGERERVFSHVLRCGNPVVLALPHDPFTHEPLLSSTQPFTPILQLHLEPGSKEVASEVLFDSVSNLRSGVGVAEVQLFGYSAGFLEELELELELELGEKNFEEAALVDWSWKRENGSQKVLLAADPLDEPLS